MDIERLNKTQIILLALLMSFVTSIATGIATVSLMEKAPTDVMRVIDRIVEKPIETIVPGAKEVVTNTVVVQESELIAKSVEMIRPSVVRVYEIKRPKNVFIAFGFVTDESGTIVSSTASFAQKKTYVAVRDDGVSFKMIAQSVTGGMTTFTPDTTQEGGVPTGFKPISRIASTNIKLGQTVIALSGSESYTVSPGVVTNISLPEADNPTGISMIRTTIDTVGMAVGTPLVTNKGEFVGVIYPTESGLFRSLF